MFSRLAFSAGSATFPDCPTFVVLSETWDIREAKRGFLQGAITVILITASKKIFSIKNYKTTQQNVR